MIPKDPPPTHLLSGEARSRQSSRKAKWVPSPKQGGWRKEGPEPNPSSVVTTPVGPWGESRCPLSPSSTLPPSRAPQATLRPGDSWDPGVVSQGTFTPSDPTLPYPPPFSSLHPGAKEAPRRAVPGPLGDVALLLYDGTLFKHSPKSPAHTKGVRAGRNQEGSEPGGAGRAA